MESLWFSITHALELSRILDKCSLEATSPTSTLEKGPPLLPHHCQFMHTMREREKDVISSTISSAYHTNKKWNVASFLYYPHHKKSCGQFKHEMYFFLSALLDWSWHGKEPVPAQSGDTFTPQKSHCQLNQGTHSHHTKHTNTQCHFQLLV